METHKQNQDEALRLAESAIRAWVAKLNATSDVRKAESDDVAQILRILIAEKAAKHDPSKASFKTFVERIVVNKIRDVLDGQHAQCRDSRKEFRSLDEPEITADGESGTFGEVLDQEEALRIAGMLPWPVDDALVMDVKMVMEKLSAIDRLTCEALSINKSLREAAKDLGIHVETLRQRIPRLRAIFEAWGIDGV